MKTPPTPSEHPPAVLQQLMAELRSATSGRPIDRDIALLAGEVAVAERYAEHNGLNELAQLLADTYKERDRLLAESMRIGGELQKLEDARAQAERAIRMLSQAVALKTTGCGPKVDDADSA